MAPDVGSVNSLHTLCSELEYLPARCNASCSFYSPLVIVESQPTHPELSVQPRTPGDPIQTSGVLLFVVLSSYTPPHKFYLTYPQIFSSTWGPLSASYSRKCLLWDIPHFCIFSPGTVCFPMSEMVASYILFSGCLWQED